MKRFTARFLWAEAGLYAAFLAMDIFQFGPSTVPVKYAGVLLCAVFSLWAAGRGGDGLVPAALALTAAADWFLLVRGDHYAAGIAIFLCVQAVYLLRLYRAGAGTDWGLRLGAALAACLGLWALKLATPLNLLAGVYFSQLFSNAALAWACRQKRLRLFALGLTLFMGCDLCVGLFNTALPSPGLRRAVAVGMWFFYLPSQVLIALTALPEKEESI